MFSRRKRSASQHRQPLSGSASQSAQSAASHAFLKSQPSTSSLSSAAAAAALRNRTPTPTSVENVQTKRMVQRAASTHGANSPLVTRRSASVSGTLRRSNSSSSMTARTFRDPSPHRPSTSSGPVGGNYQPVAVPPLPSLPAQYAGRSQPARRASSLEPSMRSPPASPQRSVRGGSMIRGGSISPVHTRISSLTTVPEQERPNSRGSVNFSYPRGARPNSPASPLFVENRTASLGPAISPEGPRDPPTTPQKQPSSKPRAQNEGSVREQSTDKPAGPAVGTAIAAAQAVSAQKSSPRADPHARAERVEREPVSQQDQTPRVGPSTVEDSDIEHPSSRAAPERWPATTPEKAVPKPSVEAPPSQETANRFAASSPTPDHIDQEVTPQSSPSVAIRDPQLLEERQANSPGRSARFSKWLSVSGNGSQIHQPPGRSVSPVKSALKHTRGSSLSPERKVSGLTIQPPSEISDGTSVASDEGSRLGAKKRMPKVSFDDEAEIVGVAASPPTSPEEYTLGSPPPKVKSRMSWLGVGKKRQTGSELGAGDNDFDHVLKPRPVLPSFGSVRGNRDGGSQEPVIPEYSDNESSSSSDEEIVTAGASFSNDHALGGILHKPEDKPKEVEKTHNVKSVEQLSVTGETPAEQSVPETKPDGVAIGGLTEQPPFVHADPALPPPSIAVEPATPPVGSDRPSKELQRVSRSSLEGYPVPGGFPPSASDRNLKSTAEASTVPQPVASAVPAHVDDADTEESDGSVYSDAAEDFDGDGFGSINAIVDQKPIPRSSAPAETARESRDTTPKPADRTSLVIDDESMDVTEQVADEARAVTPTQDSVNRQIEESAAIAVPVVIPQHEEQPSAPASPVSPVKPKTRAASHGPLPSETNEQRRPISMNVYGASSQPIATGSSVPPAGRGKQRPMSLGPAFQGTKSSGGAAFPSSLRRTTSNGSDSSSSFKRASSSNRGGGRMRRTMRSSSTYLPGPPSDRTDSPTDLRPMSSGSGPGTLRKTLRGPPGGGGGGNERYSFFSTNKKAIPGQRARPSKAPQGSRFGDSDGEGDERQPQVFRSRFADSSDEERGDSSMRPVRGIPRRRGAHDGDSTDLEDSSEEERQQQSQLRPVAGAARKTDPTPPTSRDGNVPPNMSGMAAVARQRGMTQRELEEFIMQPKARKGGFLSRIGLKKPKNVENRIRKNDMESPTRTDSPLERSRLEREQLRGDDFTNAGAPAILTTVTATQPEQPSSPKLLKKNSKRYTTGGAPWPLRTAPEPIPEQTASAPTSPLRTQKPPVDHAGRNGSLTINGGGQVLGASPIEAPASPQNARAGPDPNDDAASDITRSTEDHGPVARDVVIAGSGRKKRFPMLRKAFGLRA